ncbi:beta/alpha barrel domain-containing protein [Mycobacterium lacus]|uniref:Uncharacterized protein n=1 Tax=Mycobacterium lacus TaxID=169765 RepID=A0A1X1Y8P1_9MYCO|nr:isocitrate lyase/phosphoenolpyruvate mutase family protein [Mycobacterium lacus]MCV7123782.1 isocitrate lyase/phosphoenolpyruvate mutase family protein [Mycobacterium lacus]ORW07425.1 hypothetical protein AWC15_20095 [Mycobacterium lacus]BBX95427.1 hypothetical protein MLAC_07210 [Mycobacterium lacus]
MTVATGKRATFRAGLNSGRLQRLPGAFSPLVAKAIAENSFQGVYVSGAALSADFGLPNIGLTTLTEMADFEKFRAAVDIPLLANMTEFGKSPLLTARQLGDIGYNAVIYPVTTLRLAMFAVDADLREICLAGTQSALLGCMHHRCRLYQLLVTPPHPRRHSHDRASR